MGISCDLEAGSMESETKPTCNKEFVKLNGQNVCNELEATTAKTALAIPAASDVITVNDKTSTENTIINLVSPAPQEPETIVIVDDAEEGEIIEDGEIINTDSDFEYEAISSDEEFTLRQQIEALEAKNRELEKIASISSRAIDYDFIDGYHRPQLYGNYKTPLIANRLNSIKPNPPLSTLTNYKSLSHVENISSDEAQLVDSETEFPSIFDGSKSYGRSHRTSKKEKRQNRRKTRTNVDTTDKERCLVHGKRRCTDIECNSVDITVSRKKRARHKYDDRKGVRGKYSSDSEDELLRNRAELKMALNIIEPPNRTISSSSLSHKLSAIQNQQALDDGKKAANKHRKSKGAKSPERELDRRRRTTRTDASNSKRSKSELERVSKPKFATPIVIDESIDIQEDEDEAISLEEQELRLIALKSAVLKKHEARKKKQMATIQAFEQVIRPYSPTDSVVLVADETGERSNDCIDSDNNNMDISPISSPTNQYQPMDMDLASSNENSNSPVFSYEKPQTFPPFEQFIDWGTVAIPVPINAGYVDIDQTTATINQQPFTIQPPYHTLVYDAMQKEIATETPVSVPAVQTNLTEKEVIDNEEELRAQLIEQIRCTNNSSSMDMVEPNPAKVDDAADKIVPKENSSNVDSLEEDCLRSLLLSSKGKKSNILKETVNGTQVPIAPSKPKKHTQSTDNANCDDIPKLTLNLREALKRLKNNQQNKMAAISKPEAEIKMHVENDENEIEKCETLPNCDSKEIRKTVLNNRIDKNENELCNTGQQLTKSIASSKEPKDIMPVETLALNEADKKENHVIVQKTAVAVPKKKLIEPRTNVAAAKRANVDEISSPIASKVIVKSAPKQIAKIAANQKAAKATAINKPKPKAKIEPEPTVAVAVAVPARPKSSTPPIVSRTSFISTATSSSSTTNLTKLEALRKSTASPVIVAWTPKPVKKLIIQLNADSSSDNDDMDQSITAKNTNTDSISAEPSNTFQFRLDQFLQKVRANTKPVQEPKQQVTATTTTTTTKKIVSKTTVDKNTNNSPQKVQISSKVESSKAVAHLPMSSQLEYHRLLNRMKMLEKQKEQKSRQGKPEETPSTALKPQPPKAESNFSNLTVVVQNENRIIQTTKSADTDVEMKSTEPIKTTTINKVPINKTPLSMLNTSLAKRVLVKNAIDILNAPKPSSDSSAKSAVVKTPISAPSASVLPSVQSKQTPANAVSEPTADSKSTSMSLAAFAKKTPKVRASVLANYVKRYRNHGEQYLNGLAKLHRLTSRTNVETKKQQQLEQVLAELKQQAKIVEGQLTQQKTLTQRLYPAMAATEKTVTSDRILLHKLENCCNRLGNIVKGSDYKIQCDKETEIKEKIRQINIERNRLKLSTQTPTTASVPVAVPKSAFAEAKRMAVPKLPQIVNTANNPNKAQSIPNPILKSANEKRPGETQNGSVICANEKPNHCSKTPSNQQDHKDKLSSSNAVEKVTDLGPMSDSEPAKVDPAMVKMEVESEPNPPEVIEKCQNEVEHETHNGEKSEIVNEIEIQPSEVIENESIAVEKSQSKVDADIVQIDEINLADKIDDKPHSPDNLTEQPMSLIAAVDSETMYGKYDSPLDHMQNCVESKPSLSAADRNAIVCPYDLMGRCEDKQCEYKHLSM